METHRILLTRFQHLPARLDSAPHDPEEIMGDVTAGIGRIGDDRVSSP